MSRAIAAALVLAFACYAASATEPPPALPTWAKAAQLAKDIQREQRDGARRVEAGFPKPNIAGLQAELESVLTAAIAQHGYPRATTSGAASTDSFWLALDECRLDFRRAQRPTLETLFEAGLTEGPRLAQFVDTLLIEEGKPQRFGTVVLHESIGLVLAPLADRATVDERRKRYGLLPLAHYMALMEKLHGKSFAAATPPNPPTQAK
jgi:hypothetical protein